MEQGRSKESLGLMELLIMSVVFVMVATICVKAFVKIGLDSRSMDTENQALTAVTIAAEAVRTENAAVLSRYGISFTPGQDIPATPFQGGRMFEELGFFLEVQYDLSDETLWYADVKVTDGSGEQVAFVQVAGQKGGYHESE